MTGQLSPNVWYFAQLGLVQVAYELRRVNHHLKVFAAVRKEAFARPQTTVMSQQYQGSAIDIVYPVESLREIFVNNIRLERTDRMVLPGRLRGDPVEAFLGRKKVLHVHTGEHEDAFAYVSRNTLLRPRDLMTTGQRLSALRPEERRDETRLKEAVNARRPRSPTNTWARSPAQPGLEPKRPPPASLGPSSPGTRWRLFREHNADPRRSSAMCFCALYRVGLLGYLHHDWVRGEWVQRFLRPGEGPSSPTACCRWRGSAGAPRAVRRGGPAESRPPPARRPDQHRRLRSTLAPSGPNGRQRRPPGCCVVTADVHGFGELTRAAADAPVRHALGGGGPESGPRPRQ